jgi:hypothetical protein
LFGSPRLGFGLLGLALGLGGDESLGLPLLRLLGGVERLLQTAAKGGNQ